MALSLRDAVAEIHGELSREVSDPDELAARIVDRVRADYPEQPWKVRSIQNTAATVTGTDRPADVARRAQTPDRARSRRRNRKRARVLPRRVRVAPASTFGTLLAQMFLLVALYWLLRSVAAVETVFDRARSLARWIVEPVGWGQRPT